MPTPLSQTGIARRSLGDWKLGRGKIPDFFLLMYADIYHLHTAAYSFQLAILFSFLSFSNFDTIVLPASKWTGVALVEALYYFLTNILYTTIYILFYFFYLFYFLMYPDQELAPLDMSINSCFASAALTLPGLGGNGPVVQLLGVLPSTKSRLPPRAKMSYQLTQLLFHGRPLTLSDWT